MKNTIRACLTLLCVCLAGPVLAQSSPGLIYGQVPTAAQWNSYFAAKQNVLGYTPVNKAGDTMGGRLATPAATTAGANFNVTPGTAPTSPVNGDIWTTSAGMFVRINGATVGPIGPGLSTTLTAARIYVGNVSNVATAVDLSGDATLSNVGAITVTKTGGVSFGSFATGTNAANLTGTVASARIAGPYTGITGTGALTAGSTGAGFTIAAGTSTWTGTVPAANGGAGTITGALKANGAGLVTQAACADLSNGAASCSTDATNASNISSGILATARGGFGISVSASSGVPLFAAGTPTFIGTIGSSTFVRSTSPTIDSLTLTGTTTFPSGSISSSGVTTLGSTLFQSGGFAYFGNFNGGGLFPRAGLDLAVVWNNSGGSREIALYNTDTAAVKVFQFHKLTGASSKTTHLTLLANGFTGLYAAPDPDGQVSFGNLNAGDTVLRTYAANDQAVFNYYQAANFPTVGAFYRTLDVVAEGANTKTAIRFLTQNTTGAAPVEAARLMAGTLSVSGNLSVPQATATDANSVGLGDSFGLFNYVSDNGTYKASLYGMTIVGAVGAPRTLMSGFTGVGLFTGGNAIPRLFIDQNGLLTLTGGSGMTTAGCLANNTSGVISGGNACSGGGAVSSFNTRTGAVTPASGDYTVGQVTGAAPTASPTFTGTVTAANVATTGAVRFKGPGADYSVNAGTILCDGSTDNQTALGAALDAVIAAGGAVLQLPAGDCRANNQMTKNITGIRGLTIQGHGQNATSLTFTHGGDGLVFNWTAGDAISGPAVTLRDLSIRTTAVGAGTAVKITGNHTSGAIDPSIIVDAVAFTGTDFAHSWGAGLLTINTGYVFVSNSRFEFKSGTKAGNGMWITNPNGLDGNIYNVVNSNFDWCDKCIYVADVTEGLLVTNSNFVASNYGIYWDTSTTRSGLQVANSQFACSIYCIYMHNIYNSQITGNLIFPQASGSVGILLNSSVGNTITSNSCSGVAGAPGSNCIILQTGATDNSINGNYFNVGTTALQFDSGANNNYFNRQVMNSFSNFVINNGTGNICTSRSGTNCP